jgi:adenosine deaminase/REP element-mobilizing transposase RayT
MPALLISLGTSQAIVPEAFLLPGTRFDAVHVITTATPPTDLVEAYFASRAPTVSLAITRVAGFTDFTSEADHFRFEEVLYRWVLSTGTRADNRCFCLAGGFKTISAAMQKAAAVLGAAEVFHVLCDLPKPPSTIGEVEAAHAGDHLHWIRLGTESGWPQFRSLAHGCFPLATVRKEGCQSWVRADDSAFRDRLASIIERSHNIAGAWDGLHDLPFPILATWPRAALDWLNQPVQPDDDRTWIDALPKVELHCHLGGFATHGPLLHAVRAAAAEPGHLPALTEPVPPAGWPQPGEPVSLEEYMRLGDANGSALLKDSGCLQRQCELLYEHLLSQNILYAEIRCSPANYADAAAGRSPWQVLTEIKETFDRCMAVAASVPLAGSVEASVSACITGQPQRVAPTLEHAGDPLPQHLPHGSTARQFQPFDADAPYTQTWRDLPHRHQHRSTAFVTFRLADSLPKQRLRAWIEDRDLFLHNHPKPWSTDVWETYRRQFPEALETWLDEAHGECLLAREEIARIVASTLRHFDGQQYILDHFVIMPNHVHALVKPLPGCGLDAVLHSWKSFTAQEINRLLGRSGQVWEHESFDHPVRDRTALERFRAYIQANPQMAGLATGFTVGCGIGLAFEAGMEEESASRRLAPTLQPPQRAAATTAPVTRVNLILIATRKREGSFRAAISRHLALAVTAAEHWTDPDRCRIVGVDLAGFEHRETRAHYFREEFSAVHRCGLALTVHAGENDEAEGVWSAVFDLNARRLGHALHLVDAPELMRSVADRRIAVEMCPCANFQIKGFAPMPGRPAYPLVRYLRAGIRATVNTDNVGISSATLAGNFLLAARMNPELTRMDILRLQANALDAAFVSPIERSALRARFESLLSRP